MRGPDGLDQLEVAEVPKPSISDARGVLVRLKAAALNHLDLFTLQGLPQLELDFPHILGADGAGVVDETGRQVTRLKKGDAVMFNPGISCYACDFCLAGEHSLCERYRLLGEHLPGTLCEYVVLPEQNVATIPNPPDPHSKLTWPEAAAFSLATLTAWRMLASRARVRSGEVVLIGGVGGGVSLAALKIAKLMGAFVIVTSSSDKKLEVARTLGADVTLNYTEAAVSKEVRALTNKRGADVVIDNVGEATWDESIRSLARAGRLVTCGATSGPNVVTDVRRLFWYQYSIIGSTMGSAREYREIVSLLGQGHLRPTVDSVHLLDRGVEALERLKSGEQMGKVVVEIK